MRIKSRRLARALFPRRRRRGLAPIGLILAVALGLFWRCSEQSALAEQCAVLRVYDGDTLTVRCGLGTDRSNRLKLRVWGIDAPELGQRPWGTKAKERLRQLVRGRVTVEKLDRDNYGRTVARIYYNREDLGLRLVREGYVAVYTRYNNDHRYRDALHEAKRKRLGIWARRGQQQTPWEWRKEHSSR